MSKKPTGKTRITPEKPIKVIKKLEKNGFKLVNKEGGDWFYAKKKNGELLLVLVSVHPKELGKSFVKNIIRKSKKTNKEWVNL